MQILHNNDLFCSRPGGIDMALDLLPEPQGRVLLEVGPGREHVGAQVAAGPGRSSWVVMQMSAMAVLNPALLRH